MVDAMPKLRLLRIGHTQMTDRGFLQFAELKELGTIEIPGCLSISESGMRAFQAKRPEVRIKTTEM